MPPEHNLKFLADLIYNIKKHKCHNEANTKSNIITPILQALNWNVNSQFEVEREYPVEGIGRVDYALKVIDEIKVLIEAKSTQLDLNNYEQQIRKYATENISLFILTNGIIWHFYTWLRKGIGIHKFYTLDFNIHDEVFIAKELYNILSKQSIISTISNNYIKNIIAKDNSKYSSYAAIDEVLHSILDEPSILLCDLIVVEVNKAFNRTVEQEDVKKILIDYNKAFKKFRGEIRFGDKLQQGFPLSSMQDRISNKLIKTILKIGKKNQTDTIAIREIMPYVFRQVPKNEVYEGITKLCSIGFCELIGRKIKILNQKAGEYKDE